MRACKTLTHSSISSFSTLKTHFSPPPPPSLRFPFLGIGGGCPCVIRARPYASSAQEAISPDIDDSQENYSGNDTVEHLLTNPDDVYELMKMERRSCSEVVGGGGGRWFPYLDRFNCGNGVYLTSGEVLEAMAPYILEERKQRLRRVVENRTYSLCLVVEGLCDLGNVSAAFRCADALGVQSVHGVSYDSSKRCIGLEVKCH